MKIRTLILLAAFFVLTCAHAALNICSKCGHENVENAAVCTHCEAVLKTVKSEPKDKPDKPAGPGEELKAVADLTALAAKAYEKGDVFLALLMYKNAAALNTLSGGEAKLGEKILGFIKKCRSADGVGSRKCQVCQGGGDYVMTYNELGGEEKTRTIKNKRCDTCSGTGYVKTSLTVAEKKFKLGQAGAKFDEEMLAKRWVKDGNVWIPASLEGVLTAKQTASLRRAMPGPCGECGGFARIDCKKCKGYGKILCPGKCNHGMIRVDEEGELTKARLKRTEKCKRCKGTGSVHCEECRGQGSVLCDKCDGTGERPDCSKCAGSGSSECSKCNGTGTGNEGKCASCGGEGNILCAGCSGSGKKK